MAFLLDNNLSPRIAEALKSLGEDVLSLREIVDPSTPDTVWIPIVAKQNHVIVTADRRISKDRLEREILLKAKVTVVFLNRFYQKLPFWDQAVWLIRHWPSIRAFATAVERGSIAEVGQQGRIRPIALRGPSPP